MKAEVLCPVTIQSDGVEFGGFNQRKSEGECLVHLLTRTGDDQVGEGGGCKHGQEWEAGIQEVERHFEEC